MRFTSSIRRWVGGRSEVSNIFKLCALIAFALLVVAGLATL